MSYYRWIKVDLSNDKLNSLTKQVNMIADRALMVKATKILEAIIKHNHLPDVQVPGDQDKCS